MDSRPANSEDDTIPMTQCCGPEGYLRPFSTDDIEYRQYAEIWYMSPGDFDGYCSRAIWICLKDFQRKYGRDISASRTATRRLSAQLQRVKRCLHFWPTVYIELDSLYVDKDNCSVDYRVTFSRASREHGCDEWDHSVPDDPATPRSTYDILNERYARTQPRLVPPDFDSERLSRGELMEAMMEIEARRSPFEVSAFPPSEQLTAPPGFESMRMRRQ
jgi:hypothetical protein